MNDVPAQLAHRPVQGGKAVPWIALAMADGTFDFAGCEGRKANQSMLHGICQVCGIKIDGPYVFFMGDDQLDDFTTDVPPCCAPCAGYTTSACPMVAGRVAHYRATSSRASTTDACAIPGCDCGGWIKTEEDRESGEPAPRWFAVWCRDYDRIASTPEVVAAIRAGRPTPNGERLLATVREPVKVRPVHQAAR